MQDAKPPGLRAPPHAKDGDTFTLIRTLPDGTTERAIFIWCPGPRRKPIPASLTRASKMLADGWNIE
jgi:hypothetical protein